MPEGTHNRDLDMAVRSMTFRRPSQDPHTLEEVAYRVAHVKYILHPRARKYGFWDKRRGKLEVGPAPMHRN